MALFSDFFPINGNTTVANSGEQFGSLAPFTILQTGNGGTDSVRVHTVTGVFTPGNFVSATGTLLAGTDITGFTATLKLVLGGAEVFVSGVITMAPVGGLVGQGQIMLRSATPFAVATDTDTNLGLADDSGLIINGDQAVAGDTTILGTILVDGDTSLSQDAGSNTNIAGDMFTITSSSTEIDSNTISLNSLDGGTINLGNDDTTTQETINIATGDGANGTEYILNLGTGQDAKVNIGDTTDSIITVDGALLDINADDVNLGPGAFAGTAGHIETWAEGGNLDRIPASKLPDIAIGEVHTVILTDAETTDILGAPSTTDIAADLGRDAFVFPGDEGNQINAGDIIIATGTIAGGTLGNGLTVTALYVNQTGKATGAGSTIIATDFRIISSGAEGISSLEGGAGITTLGNVITADILTGVTGNMQLLGVGALAQIALADNVDVQGTLDVTGNATFDNLVSIPLAAAGETFIVGNGTANGAISIGTGGARTITVGNGTTVATTISAAQFDISGSTSGSIDVSGTGTLSLSSVDGNTTVGAGGTGELRVQGTDITPGSDANPAILGVGTNGKLQTTTVSTRYTYFPLNVATTDVAVTAVNTVVDLTGAVPAGNMDRIVALTTFVPAVGDSIKIVNRATVATDSSLSIRLPVAHTIHGSVDNELTLDDLTVSFELYYTADATNTWLIIGAN